jgi:hypothetical protein
MLRNSQSINIMRDDKRSDYFYPNRAEGASNSILKAQSSGLSESSVLLFPSPWDAINLIIDEWAALEAGWDDDHTPAPDPEAIEAIKFFVKRAKTETLPKPDPYIAGDGEFGFTWNVRGNRASLSFLADGDCLAYVSQKDDEPLRLTGGWRSVTRSSALVEAIGKLSA